MRIGRANDLRQKAEGRIGQAVLLENRVERHILAVVSEFAAWHVVNDPSLRLAQSVSAGKKTNSAAGSMNFLMSQGRQRDRPLPFRG